MTGTEETYLLASGISGTTWSDDGSQTPDDQTAADDGIPVLPPGTLSLWTELPGAMNHAREGLGACRVVVPSGFADVDDATYLYAGGGRPDASGAGYHATIERAQVLENGDLDTWIVDDDQMQVTRAFFPLLTTQDRKFTPFPDVPPEIEVPILTSIYDEPIYLFALQGDDTWASSSNSGRVDMEAAYVTSPDGDLEAWHVQNNALPSGRRTLAHDGVFVDDYVYILSGVDTENVGGEPQPLDQTMSRFPLDIDADPANTLLGGYMAANGEWQTIRSYYDVVRTNAFLFTAGGNDGNGPLATMEKIHQ
jgi:hypothetical protein